MSHYDKSAPVSPAAARNLRAAAWERLAPRYRTDWRYVAPDFADAFAYLRATPAALESGPEMARDRDTVVRDVRLPAAFGGGRLAWKQLRGRRQWRYACRPTLAAKEAANYLFLGDLGFPLARLLAAGDDRTFFYTHGAYLATAFVEGFTLGTVFMRDGPNAGPADDALRGAYIDACLSLVARMHVLYFSHKGFKPYNIFWRRAPGSTADAPRLELRLIDVAVCRFAPRRRFTGCVLHDVGAFMKFVPRTAAQIAAHAAHYLAENPECGVTHRRLTDYCVRHHRILCP